MLTLEVLRSLYDVSPNAYVVLHPDAPRFTIAEANQAYLKATSTDRSKILGKGILEAFPGDPGGGNIKQFLAVKASLDHALLLKRSHKIVLQRYDIEVDGNYEGRFWSFDTFPLLDESGQVQFIVQCPIDVTASVISGQERVIFEGVQEARTDFNSPLVQNYPDAVFSLDLKGNFLSANKAVLDLVECSKEILLESSFIPFIAPEDFERAFNYFQEAIAGKMQHFDARVISAKNTPRELSITNLPIVVNEKVIGVHCIAKDITALREAERQLEGYHKRLAGILESITDGFFAVDQDWVVSYWNKKAEQILLRNRDEVIGKNLWEVYSDAVPLRFFTEYHKAMQENTPICFEEYYPTLGIWIEVSAFPSETGLSVYFKDITERVNYVRAVEEQNRRLREISWEQSHVVRAPLATILGLAEFLSDNNIDEATRSEFLPSLKKAAVDLDVVIHDIVRKADESDSLANGE